MTPTLRKSKHQQLLSRMLLMRLLIVALAGCSTAAAAASATFSALNAVLIQPSTVVIRQFTLLSQPPAISVDVCSELWAAESASNSDAAS